MIKVFYISDLFIIKYFANGDLLFLMVENITHVQTYGFVKSLKSLITSKWQNISFQIESNFIDGSKSPACKQRYMYTFER